MTSTEPLAPDQGEDEVLDAFFGCFIGNQRKRIHEAHSVCTLRKIVSSQRLEGKKLQQ
jgi:hypothetical protein